MLNIEKMFVLIAARPMIRTVEIADIIDCDIDQVQPALQPHVDCGDLALTEVTAPNGRPANAFTITRQFMGSSRYENLLPDIRAQRLADEAVRPAPAPTAKPVAAPRSPEQSMIAPGVQRTAAAKFVPTPVEAMPVFSQTTKMPSAAPFLSKLDRALAYLTEHQQATSAELRPVMGLGPAEYPSSHFGTAIIAGLIQRVGRVYKLGPKPRAPEIAVTESASPAKTVVEAVRNIAVAPVPAAAPAAGPARLPFRFARWSDGSVEIQRHGRTLIILEPDECVQLAVAMVATTMQVAQ